MCDVFSTGYNVRYRLSSSTGNYTTVSTSSSTTSVTLRDLAPNAEYDVEVAAIFSNGAMSNFSAVTQFTVTPPEESEPSKILYFSYLYSYHLLVVQNSACVSQASNGSCNLCQIVVPAFPLPVCVCMLLLFGILLELCVCHMWGFLSSFTICIATLCMSSWDIPVIPPAVHLLLDYFHITLLFYMY